jgi:DNA-binding NtrC family response regulator
MAVIVVIDDEPVVLELLGMVLRLDGHDLQPLSDPVAAYEVITSAETAVDLVITDAGLKPISGFELVNRLRMRGILCPVLVISGHHGLNAPPSGGPMEILEKPFTAAQLRAAVNDALTPMKAKPHHAG